LAIIIIIRRTISAKLCNSADIDMYDDIIRMSLGFKGYQKRMFLDAFINGFQGRNFSRSVCCRLQE